MYQRSSDTDIFHRGQRPPDQRNRRCARVTSIEHYAKGGRDGWHGVLCDASRLVNCYFCHCCAALRCQNLDADSQTTKEIQTNGRRRAQRMDHVRIALYRIFSKITHCWCTEFRTGRRVCIWVKSKSPLCVRRCVYGKCLKVTTEPIETTRCMISYRDRGISCVAGASLPS